MTTKNHLKNITSFGTYFVVVFVQRKNNKIMKKEKRENHVKKKIMKQLNKMKEQKKVPEKKLKVRLEMNDKIHKLYKI